MADYLKKMRKGGSDELLPGEEYLAAGTWTPPAYRQGSKSGELEARRKIKARVAAAPDALASRVTLFKGFLGLTNHRLLFFGISPTLAKPTLLKASFELAEVDHFAVDKAEYHSFETGEGGGAYDLVFADSSTLGLRLVSNSNEQFMAMFANQQMGAQS